MSAPDSASKPPTEKVGAGKKGLRPWATHITKPFTRGPEVALGAKFNLTQPTDHVTEVQHETQMIFDYDQLGLRNVLSPGKRTPHMTGRHL